MENTPKHVSKNSSMMRMWGNNTKVPFPQLPCFCRDYSDACSGKSFPDADLRLIMSQFDDITATEFIAHALSKTGIIQKSFREDSYGRHTV
jgi:hypothetical protein